MQDIRGNPLSLEESELAQLFEAALKSFQTYTGDPVAEIDQLLSQAPNFVLGHLFRALNYYLSSERRFLPAAQRSLAAAQALQDQANPHEQMLTQAVQQLIDGQWELASASFDHVLCAYPRDIFTLQAAHLMDFFRGDANNLRNRPARVVPEWHAEIPGYSYVLGMYAFGLEESNQYELAEQWGRRALELEPDDAWSVHAVTHVMEMQGRADEGIGFLTERQANWAVDNNFAYHNWWHLSLLHLERFEDERVLEIYDQHIAPAVEDLSIGLVDVTAMLWRLKLLGLDVTDRFMAAAQAWSTKSAEAGFYAFNDLHAALAFVGAGQTPQVAQLEQAMQRALASDSEASRMMSEQIGLPLIRGVLAYAAGNWGEACEHLGGVRDVAHRFGGSHAQRDIINLTLLDAAQRDDNRALVRHLMNERQMAKPKGVLGQRVLDAAA